VIRLVNSRVIALAIRSKDLQESAVTTKTFLWMRLEDLELNGRIILKWI